MHIRLQKAFWYIGLAEATSLLVLLFVAMPLKYVWQMPQAVSMVGMAHGVLFILYGIMLTYFTTEHKLPFKLWLQGGLASILPFGPFWYHKKWKAWAASTTTTNAIERE